MRPWFDRMGRTKAFTFFSVLIQIMISGGLAPLSLSSNASIARKAGEIRASGGAPCQNDGSRS